MINWIFFLLITVTFGKNILLTNDDGWTSTDIRTLYRDLKKAGHEVIMVAPVSQRSGFAGQFVVPSSNKLETDGEFGYVKAGAPAWDYDRKVNDTNIWYFNGTPSSVVAFAFEYLLPTKFPDTTIDLVVAGVNQGPNLSPGFYTASGTNAACYSSIYRGYPAISFSGYAYQYNNTFFKDSMDTDDMNPANIYSKLSIELIEKVLDSGLPELTGLNVNFPAAGHLNENCTDPEWVKTRVLKSNIFSQNLQYDTETESFAVKYSTFQNIETDCKNGDSVCGLDGEFDVYNKQNCQTTISVFTVDNTIDSDTNDKVYSSIKDLF